MSKEELEDKIKGSVLRPVASRFVEITKALSSDEYETPSEEELKAINEDVVQQGYERIQAIITQALREQLEEIEKLATTQGVVGIDGKRVDITSIPLSVIKEMKRNELRAEQRQDLKRVMGQALTTKGGR